MRTEPCHRYTGAILAGLAIAAVACSSSSTSPAAAVDCEIPDPSQSLGICTCTAGGTSNGTACSAVSLSGDDTDAVCLYSASTKECDCVSFFCFSNTCYYAQVRPSTPHASSCSGAHYCLGTNACECGATACASDEEELTSCSDDTAKAKLKALRQSQTGDAIVPDCRAALANGTAGGSGSGSGGTNICPGGPGKCQDGDSSTCNCGTACVQTAVCAGCAYECVKGCATDLDCAGFYSSDLSAGGAQPLVCVGATIPMPTPHCG